jgi:hypothetical protein
VRFKTLVRTKEVRYEFDMLSECGVTRPMIYSNIKGKKGLRIGVHGCLVSFVVGVADSMISDQSIADQCISANRSEKSAAFCSELLIEGLGLFSSLLMVVFLLLSLASRDVS